MGEIHLCLFLGFNDRLTPREYVPLDELRLLLLIILVKVVLVVVAVGSSGGGVSCGCFVVTVAGVVPEVVLVIDVVLLLLFSWCDGVSPLSIARFE